MAKNMYVLEWDNGTIAVYDNKYHAKTDLIDNYYHDYLESGFTDMINLLINAREKEDAIERAFLINQVIDDLKTLNSDLQTATQEDYISSVGYIKTGEIVED